MLRLRMYEAAVFVAWHLISLSKTLYLFWFSVQCEVAINYFYTN